jgi:hypothetical protein
MTSLTPTTVRVARVLLTLTKLTYPALVAAVELQCDCGREAATTAVDGAFADGLFGVFQDELVVDRVSVRTWAAGRNPRKQQ